MKRRPNTFLGATALRIALSAIFISTSFVLLASNFKAAPATNEPGAAIVPGFGGNNSLTSETWTLTGSLNLGRDSHTATLLPNGKVLVAGGRNGSVPPYAILASAELYDPASWSWMVTGSLNAARRDHTATLLPNGKVLAVGGAGSSTELYDPASGTWTVAGSLNTAREQGHTATLLPNGQVLVAGGYNFSSGYLASTELYDPASGTWTVTGNLNNARGQHTATLLPNGNVLVTGGIRNSSLLSSAELYDPITGIWTATGSLAVACYSHTATLLPNGKVLVAGGYNFSSGYLASTELYDPGTGNWTATGSLNTARDGHTATPLPNGKVLAAGGFGFGLLTTSAELYDPITGIWTATGSLNTTRAIHTATLLPNGTVMVAAGIEAINGMHEATGRSAELYGQSVCSLCHKHSATLSLECGSLEFRRHLDHGDTVGTCPPSKKPSDQTDSLGEH